MATVFCSTNNNQWMYHLGNLKITIFYRVIWKMQWLFLSEYTNQLLSLILRLKQVKPSEKSSFVSLENHVFHEIFHSFLRVSASNSRREKLICARLRKMKPLHFRNYPIGCRFFLRLRSGPLYVEKLKWHVEK